MDDQRLSDLFRSAAADVEPPPAAFDHADVLAGSHRIARRQRVSAAVAAVALAGLGVGTLVLGGLGRSGPTSSLAEAPPSASAARDDTGGASAPEDAGQAQPPPLDQRQAAAAPNAAAPNAADPNMPAPNVVAGPEAAPALSGGPSARSKSLAAPPGIVAGCYRPSAEVFGQLSAVLPEVADRTPRPVPGGCGEGGTGVAVDVPGGTVAVVLTPSGVSTPEPADGPTQRSVVVTARSGRVLRVTTRSPEGAPPYQDRLRRLADELADRL